MFKDARGETIIDKSFYVGPHLEDSEKTPRAKLYYTLGLEGNTLKYWIEDENWTRLELTQTLSSELFYVNESSVLIGLNGPIRPNYAWLEKCLSEKKVGELTLEVIKRKAIQDGLTK